MTRRRRLPVLLLLSSVVAAATLAQAWIAYGQTRSRLDQLVRQLGGAIAEAAAADLRSSRAVLDELERELEDSLRWKAELLARPTAERRRDDARVLARFGRVAGLKHLFVFDDEGALTMAARDVPQRSAGTALASLQVRLLRVVQERRVMRVGSHEPIDVDVRLLVATHRDLAEMVRAETFREDLYFRLNVIEIHVPPLRERPEDIPILAERLLQRHAKRNAVAYRSLSTEALAALVRHEFPGNVRELENLLERALILARGDEIGPADFPRSIEASPASESGAPQTLTAAVEALERAWIRRALADSNGVRAQAVRRLGLPDRNLRYKMRKHGIDKSRSSGDGEG